MKPSALRFVCPGCQGELDSRGELQGTEIIEGSLGCRSCRNVQADIFAMPFRESALDLAYSIGVLHHTPDLRAAFDRVVAVVKKGGRLAVYLYSRYGFSHRVAPIIRWVATRLPRRLILAASVAAIPLYYCYRLPMVGKVTRLLLPISRHPNWHWRWLDTVDWYTPRYQWKFLYPEVCQWFRTNGFLDIELFDGPIRMRGTKTA